MYLALYFFSLIPVQQSSDATYDTDSLQKTSNSLNWRFREKKKALLLNFTSQRRGIRALDNLLSTWIEGSHKILSNNYRAGRHMQWDFLLYIAQMKRTFSHQLMPLSSRGVVYLLFSQFLS